MAEYPNIADEREYPLAAGEKIGPLNGGDVAPEILSVSRALTRWIALCEIIPVSSAIDPLYLSSHDVRSPERFYEGRIKSFGTFTRSISAPVGFIRTGDGQVTIADADNKIRRLISAKSIRKAKLSVYIGQEGKSLLSFYKLFTREVSGIDQSQDGELTIKFADYIWSFLDQKIPAVIDSTNFDSLPSDSVGSFAPIILGTVTCRPQVQSGESDPGGVISPILIDSTNHKYLVARHPCSSVQVWRKRSSESAFTVMSSGNITRSNSLVTSGHRCEFFIPSGWQSGDEYRVNVVGSCYGSESYQNFSDAIKDLISSGIGISYNTDNFNTASFDETQSRLGTLPCNGTFTSQLTWGEALTQLQRSSNIDIFNDANDKITLHSTIDGELSVLPLDENIDFLKGSIKQSDSKNCYNQFPYNFTPNYISNKWAGTTYDNEDDQSALDGAILPADLIQFYFLRNYADAGIVIERRSKYECLESFTIEADIPLIQNIGNSITAAQSRADNAASNYAISQTNETAGNSLMQSLAVDNRLMQAEKQDVVEEWDSIYTEMPIIDAEAEFYSVTTKKSSYDAAFQSLATYLNDGTTWTSGTPSWISGSNLLNITDIVSADFQSAWSTFYAARTALWGVITTAAQAVTDNTESLCPNSKSIDLANIANISYFGGLKSGGYVNEKFKITELSTDIDNMKINFKGVKYIES